MTINAFETFSNVAKMFSISLYAGIITDSDSCLSCLSIDIFIIFRFLTSN